MEAPLLLTALKPAQLVQLFFDEQKALDSENLRQFASEKLHSLQKRWEQCLTNTECAEVWQKVADRAVVEKQEHLANGYHQMQELGIAIAFWLAQAVESAQRFNFFVLEKATEISSGDRDRDYYHALMIRHDQILAACVVLETAVEQVEQSCQLTMEPLLQSEALRFLSQVDLEARIFSQAELLFKTRQQLGLF